MKNCVKVLFVCHGNICRSPMAEFILKDMVEKQGLSHEFYIESAATSSEEIWNGKGNPVYPPAERILREHGISCKGKRARQVIKEDYDRFDMIILMDENNRRNIKRIIPSDPEKKISLMMDYTDCPGDVADPWYSGDFQRTWDDICLGCEGLLESLF